MPGPPLQVRVEGAVHDGLPPPGQLGRRPPLVGRPAPRALRPQRPHRRRVRVDGRARAGDARGLPAQRGHFVFWRRRRREDLRSEFLRVKGEFSLGAVAHFEFIFHIFVEERGIIELQQDLTPPRNMSLGSNCINKIKPHWWG